jgi:hypothetical protein
MSEHAMENKGLNIFNEIDLQPVGLFIPFHRLLQGFQGKSDLIQLPRLHKKRQCDLSTGSGEKAVGPLIEPSGHYGEQIGGLWERVLPGGPVASFGLLSRGN